MYSEEISISWYSSLLSSLRISSGTMLSGIPAPSSESIDSTCFTPSTSAISSVMATTSFCGTSASTSTRWFVDTSKVSDSFVFAFTLSSSCGRQADMS